MTGLSDMAEFDQAVQAMAQRLDLIRLRISVPGFSDSRLLADALAGLRDSVEELAVSGEEMRAQRDALAAQRAELEARHGWHRALVDLLPGAYLVTDCEGLIEDASRQAADLLNAERHRLAGKPLAVFVAPTHQVAFRALLGRAAGRGPAARAGAARGRESDTARGGAAPGSAERGGAERGREELEIDISPRGRAPMTVSLYVAAVPGDPAGRLHWLLRDASERAAARARIASLERELTATTAPGHALRAASRELASIRVAATDLEGALTRVTDLVEKGVEPAGAAGLLLAESQPAGQGEPPWPAYGRMSSVCSAEWAVGEGPHLDCLREREPVVTGDLADDGRWPALAAAHRIGAPGAPPRSVLVVPLDGGGAPTGALSVGAAAPDAFGDEEIAGLTDLAETAAAAVANVRAYHGATRLAEQMAEAMASRAVIEQAKGVLMARRRVRPDEAFGLLRGLSQSTHRKLRDVAGELVRGAAADPGTHTASG